jgi:CRP-like cAMP-binding protein
VQIIESIETRPQFIPFQNYSAGQIIFQNEQTNNRLFVVADGAVAIYYKQKLVEIIRAGNFFSDPFLSKAEQFSVTAIASSDCQIIALTPDEFHLLKQYDSPLLKLTLKTMANCLGA